VFKVPNRISAKSDGETAFSPSISAPLRQAISIGRETTDECVTDWLERFGFRWIEGLPQLKKELGSKTLSP
jgi:hypothetical protein